MLKGVGLTGSSPTFTDLTITDAATPTVTVTDSTTPVTGSFHADDDSVDIGSVTSHDFYLKRADTQLLKLTGSEFVGIGVDFHIGGTSKELRFYEGANYVGFEAPALSADKIWVLPSADGSANQLLKTDGSGNLGWLTPTLGTHTTGNYVGTVTAGTGLTSTGATSGEGIAHSLSVDASQSQITAVGTITSLDADALTVDDVAINGDTITFQDGEVITRAATDQMFFKTNGSTSGGKWQFNMGASNWNVLSMAQTGDGVGGTVVNEDGLDRDFRIETNDNANALAIDGGTNFMGFGAAASTSVNYFFGRSKAYTAATGGDEYIAYLLSNSNAITTAGSGTHGVIATLGINEPEITIGTAGVTNAVTLLINNAPTEGTNNYALWVNSGNCQFDGNIAVDGTITGTLATAAQGSVTSLGTLTELQVDSINLNGNTLSVTTDNPLLINPPSGRPVLIDGAVAIDAGVVTGVSSLTVSGAVSKGSGSFSIAHPLPALTDTHRLVHSFVEGPQADLIYRGTVTLSGGTAKINIDTAAGMTEGTFVLLCRDVQCFTTNEADWTPIKGAVSGNVLTITSQDETSTATVSWIVIGERQDDHMKLDETDWCDADGRVIVEPLKPEED